MNVATSTPRLRAACAKPHTNGQGKTTPSSGLYEAATTPSVSSSGTMARASFGVSIRVGSAWSFCSFTLDSSARRLSSVRARKRYPPCRNHTLIFISEAKSRHIWMLSCIRRTFASLDHCARTPPPFLPLAPPHR